MNDLQTRIDNLTEGLNKEQEKAVKNPICSCTKIVAGAGTGKTKIISKRFVKLVFDLINDGIENPCEHILVITFTDKAANEMKSRIVNELAANGIDTAGSDLWISTFHGFCSKILRKHSIETGLSPSFKLGDEQQLNDVYQNIVRRIKYNEYCSISDIDKICNDLNIDKNILDIKNIKNLSKLNKIDIIFEEIYSLIKKIKSYGFSAKEFLTRNMSSTTEFSNILKSLPFGFETKEEYIINWENHLSRYCDDFCKFEDIRVKADGKKEDKGAFASIAATQIVLSKNGKSTAKNWGYSPKFPECIDSVSDTEKYLIKLTALIYSVYQNELELIDMIDFDDLINKTVSILKNNDLINNYYKKYFRHLVIDEFQDTNASQLELIKLLLSDEEADITFVGDRKQSIYGFRFAQMENLEVLHKYIEQKYNEKFEEIKLKTNYRSTPQVLNAVNYVTEEHLGLNENLEPNLTPVVPYDIDNKYVKYTTFVDFPNSYEKKIAQGQYIASEILKYKSLESVKYKDFAVLVESHSQADLVEKILTNEGIPSVKKVNTSFFTTPLIKNVTALIRLLANSRDESAFVRILKIKLSDAELFILKNSFDKTILKTKKFEELKKMNLCDKFHYIFNEKEIDINLSDNIREYINVVYDIYKFLYSNRTNLTLLQSYYKLINTISPYAGLNNIETKIAERNLRIFEKIIADYSTSKNFVSAGYFLKYLDLIKNDKNYELPSVSTSELNAVQILTIHASKGLEFPYVFVFGMSSGSAPRDITIDFDMQYGNKPGFGFIIYKYEGSPTPKALMYKELWKKPREKNEDIRLFYVAVSRAEKYLNVLTDKKAAEYTKYFPEPILSEQIKKDTK